MRRKKRIVLLSVIAMLLLAIGTTAVLLAQGQEESAEGTNPGPYVK